MMSLVSLKTLCRYEEPQAGRGTVKRQRARGSGRAGRLTAFWAFTQVVQRHTWTVPTPTEPAEHTAQPHATLGSPATSSQPQPATAHLHLLPSSIHASAAIVKLSNSNFFLLPLAFADDRPCACSGYLLTRFRPQEPLSTVSERAFSRPITLSSTMLGRSAFQKISRRPNEWYDAGAEIED